MNYPKEISGIHDHMYIIFQMRRQLIQYQDHPKSKKMCKRERTLNFK